MTAARSSPTSIGVTSKPASRSAGDHLQRRTARLTSRSAEMPPIRTATRVMRTASRLAGRDADAVDFPFQRRRRCRRSTRRRTSSPRRLEVGRGGGAGVDQEVAVLLRHLRAADASGRGSRRRRSAPTPSWPGGFLKVEPPVRARTGCDRPRARRGSPPCARRSPPARRRRARSRARVTTSRRAAARSGDRRSRDRPRQGGAVRRCAVDDLGPVEHVRELAAIGAGVHRHRAADAAGNAGQELQPGQPGRARHARRR